MKPFRVDKLVGQARRWSLPALDDALAGLLELDAMVKGAPGSGATEGQRRMAFALWVRDRVAVSDGAPAPAARRP
jgi:DNA polymerase III delta subunit